jgi:hypothetical protein
MLLGRAGQKLHTGIRPTPVSLQNLFISRSSSLYRRLYRFCIDTNFVHPRFSAQNCIVANWYAHIELAPIYRTFPLLTRSWRASMVSSIGTVLSNRCI